MGIGTKLYLLYLQKPIPRRPVQRVQMRRVKVPMSDVEKQERKERRQELKEERRLAAKNPDRENRRVARPRACVAKVSQHRQ